MNRKRWLVVFLVVLLIKGTVFFWAAGSKEVTGKGMNIPEPEREILEAFDAALANASNEFGLALFKQLADDEENVFISPTSIYTALAMTYNGAGGETLEAMAEVLGVKEVELKRFNENNLARLYLLQEADPEVTVNIANSLWLSDWIAFNPDFVERNARYYDASARVLDFSSRAAVDTINNWVVERTNGLIEEIVAYPIDPDTVLFLINAVYFLGEWTEPFKPEATQKNVFHGHNGEIEDVSFMQRTGNYAYLEMEGEFQAIRLPYGKAERLAMYVFLPHEKSSLSEVVAGLDGDKWDLWRSQFASMRGNLILPRFSMDYEKTLNEVLKDMGMEIAFDEDRADFFDMVVRDRGDRLYISGVKHKSFIRVDEKGTEAAAVTAVELGAANAPLDYFRMDVNRPFFFLIHDRDTNEILFTGTVVDPTA